MKVLDSISKFFKHVVYVVCIALVCFMVGCEKDPPIDVPDDDDDIVVKTIEPGSNLGDVGQVVFSYRGKQVIYKTVRLNDGSIWLQQNLGAVRVAVLFDDYLSYGDLFQWGRWDDGHQVAVRNQGYGNIDAPLGSSSGIETLPEPNNPVGLGVGSPFFYYKAYWWKDVKSAKVTAATQKEVSDTVGCDPCRAIAEGWRMPTKEEWENVISNTGNILGSDIGINSTYTMNTATASISALKLPAAGFRVHNTGKLNSLGSRGIYWSINEFWNNSQNVGQAYTVSIGETGSTVSTSYRGYGFSVRCLKKK